VEVGDSLAAVELLERKFAAREKLFKPEHPAFLRSLDNLASIYALCGAWEKALPLFRRSLLIKESLSVKGPLDLADSVAALARCCSKLGNYGEALILFQRVVSIKEAALGKESPGVAESLCDLAKFCESQGNYEQALALQKRSLLITESFFGPEHPDVAGNLIGLADVYRAQGNYKEALVLSQRGLNMMEKSLGKENPALVGFLANLTLIYLAQGNYEQALSLCERALSINEKSFGKNHDSVISSLNLLALLYLEHGDLDQGIGYLSATLKALRANFVITYLGVSDTGGLLQVADETKLKFVSQSFFLDEMYHSVCAEIGASGSQNARCWGAEQLALDKALLEEVKVAQYRLGRTWTKDSWQRSQAIEFELSSLTETNLSLAQREKRRELQAELKEIKNKWVSEWQAWQASIETLKLTDISQAIPAQSALIDFVQFHRYDFSTKTNEAKELRYAAYLTFPLAHDSTNVVVERVDLGEAAPINDAVELVCKRMSAGQFAAKDLSPALQQLSDLVYAPLAPYLTNVSHLIVCPDGQLSRLPFEMLSVGNKFLIEEKTISYVTSGQEVVRIASPKSSVHSSKSLVMGNPDFNLDLNVAQASQPAGSAGILARSYGDAKQDASRLAGKMPALLSSAATRSLSRSYRGMTFTPLPGSGVEATNVAKLLGSDAVLRLGPEAREAELKAVVSPRVLHLATHGFFLSDQEFNHTNSFAWSSAFTRLGPSRNGGTETPNNWENPLVRCGIALAGANHAMQITNAIAEDGLLTGLEASLLNLQGTELVILSACDSGTGEVKIGEGVMSLRRAFRIAGAESVLASHWPVNDKATSRLMMKFMRRWRAGEPRAQAWREAQLELLRSKDFSNPYFWSAFTLTGQWN
jgi:CHAT domain-containing protein